MSCNECPYEEKSRNLQNINEEIMDIWRLCGTLQTNWPCHMDRDEICPGYIAMCKTNGRPYKDLELLTDKLKGPKE